MIGLVYSLSTFSIPKDFIAMLSILSFSFMENSLDWILPKYEMGNPKPNS